MSKFNPPKEISFEGNLSENWERWKKEFQFYLTATESNDKDEDVKTSRLLTTIGEKARDIYYTFTFAEEGDNMKLTPVMAKFDEYFNLKKNLPYTRFKFFTYNQASGQTIDEYVTELKSRSRHCEFGTLRDSLVRDRIVAGIQDAKVRERLLRETDLTLEKAMAICRAAEATKKQAEEIKTSPPSDNVDAVNFRRRDTRHPASQRPKANGPGTSRTHEQSKACKYCGHTVRMRGENAQLTVKCATTVESGITLPQFANRKQSITSRQRGKTKKVLSFMWELSKEILTKTQNGLCQFSHPVSMSHTSLTLALK